MFPSCRFALLVWVILVVTSAPTVSAEETPLPLIPTQTGLLVRFKNPKAIFEKVAAIVDRLQSALNWVIEPDDETAANWREIVSNQMPITYYSVGDGLDENRDSWMFFSNPITAISSQAHFIPAKDTDALRLAVARDLAKFADDNGIAKEDIDEIVVYKDWVIHGSLTEMAAIKQRIAGELKSIETRFDAESRAIFDKGDVGLFVDLNHLSVMNSFFLAMGQAILNPLFDSVQVGSVQVDGVDLDTNVKATKNMFDEITGLIAQTVFDLDHLVITVSIEPEQIVFEHHLSVREGSVISALFADNPPAEMQTLSNLPSGNAVYLGMHFNWKSMMQWTARHFHSKATDNDTKQAWKGISKEYQQLQIGTVAIAYPVEPLELGPFRSLCITEVDHPQRYHELEFKAQSVGINSNVLERSQETLGEYSLDVVRYAPPNLQKVGDVTEEVEQVTFAVQSAMLGPDGNTQRSVILQDRVVTFHGGAKLNSADVPERVFSLDRSRVAEPYMARLRDKLDKRANLIVMLDPGRIAAALLVASQTYLGVLNEDTFDVAEPNGQVEIKSVAEEEVDEKDSNDRSNEPGPVESDSADQSGRSDTVFGVKFTQQEMDMLRENASLVGFSLSMQPKSCHCRIVIPVDSIHQLVKAGDIVYRRIIESMDDAESEEEAE